MTCQLELFLRVEFWVVRREVKDCNVFISSPEEINEGDPAAIDF